MHLMKNVSLISANSAVIRNFAVTSGQIFIIFCNLGAGSAPFVYFVF